MRHNIRTALLRVIVIPLVAVTVLGPLPTSAAGVFNPHFIISDEEMRDAKAMDFSDIAAFLSTKGKLSSQFDVDPGDGLLKGAAQLVDDAAKRYQINPKYILALLQKESSIVETPVITRDQMDWAAGYALCDGCYKKNVLAQKYKGLAKQIDAGAGWMHWYLTNAENLGYLKQKGAVYQIDNMKVAPQTAATAALYSYTPHIHGNRLLWSIMRRWFGGGTDLSFPDGTLVRNEKNGAMAVVQGGKMRPILNRSVLESRFNVTTAVDLNEYDFASLLEAKPGRPVRFADLSLVRTNEGATYLLIGNAKRRIPDAATFAKIGFNPEEVEDVVADDVADYVEGEPITVDAAFPLGQLLQDRSTGGIFYAESGVKHPLYDRALLKANFAGKPVLPATPGELAKLTTGDAVRLADGTLVKLASDPTVYLISGGKKLKIPTEDVFLGFGYRFENVLTASPKMLALHELGSPLSLGVETPGTND